MMNFDEILEYVLVVGNQRQRTHLVKKSPNNKQISWLNIKREERTKSASRNTRKNDVICLGFPNSIAFNAKGHVASTSGLLEKKKYSETIIFITVIGLFNELREVLKF